MADHKSPSRDIEIKLPSPVVRQVSTTGGPARVHVYSAAGPPPRGTVLLGHGAGAGVESTDLQALTALVGHGWRVALLEQPWRVAGRRLAVAPPK
ncbi:MAG: hypothetical protein WA994_03775, partial [Ornithinimicrobium sp.]